MQQKLWYDRRSDLLNEEGNMLLIWKGFGILTIFIISVSMIDVQAVVDNIFGTDY